MKNLFTFLFLTSIAFSQTKVWVSGTHLPDNLLNDTTLKEAIQYKISTKNNIYFSGNNENNIVATKMHSFVTALHFAFAEHRPMVISPDMIWLLILQGLSGHIHANPDQFKDKILNQNYKKEILVINDKLRIGSNKFWPEVALSLSDSVTNRVYESYSNLFLKQFSTSNLQSQIAFKVAMLNSLNLYFDYNVESACGIPYINLKGSPEDWKWINENIEKLNQFNLGFWTFKLKRITEKIYQTSIGNSDTTFWRNIYKFRSESGGDKITGWFLDFFPYNGNTLSKQMLYDRDSVVKKYVYKNNIDIFKNDSLYKLLGKDSLQMNKLFNKKSDKNKDLFQLLSSMSFSTGISHFDFKWKYFGELLKMKYYGGFVGIKQDPKTFELEPLISWFVKEDKEEKIEFDPFKDYDFWGGCYLEYDPR